MRGLTKRQGEALAFIRTRIASCAPSPTLSEIADVVGLKHKSGAHRIVEELVEMGYLVRRGKRLDLPAESPVAPRLVMVREEVVRQIVRVVEQPATAKHAPLDRSNAVATRRSRTYVIELDGDVHRRLRRTARQVDLPPERIIMMAVRDFIMDADRR